MMISGNATKNDKFRGHHRNLGRFKPGAASQIPVPHEDQAGFKAAALFIVLVGVAIIAGCDTRPPAYQCPDAIGCVRVAAGEPIKIGVLEALTGKVAPLGEEQIRGTQLAMDKHHGKFLNHPIVLQVEDTGCTPEGGANAALKLIADPQTVAILGTTCSNAAATASKAMSDAGMTMLSGNNSAPFLTSIAGRQAPNWQPGYFRTAFNEEFAGKAAALFAFQKLGIRIAATINDGDIYTRGLTDGFAKAFEQAGGRIVLSASVNKGDKQMQPVLTAVINAKAELLFFPLFQPEGNLVLTTARRTKGFERIVLMSDGALIESSFINEVQSAAKGMYFVGPAHPQGPAADALAETYRARFKSQPATSYYLSAFDAMELLLAALEKATTREPDGTLHIGREALRKALYAMRDFPGATGRLSCSQFGDCAYPAFNILRLEDPRAGLQGLLSNVLFTYKPENNN